MGLLKKLLGRNSQEMTTAIAKPKFNELDVTTIDTAKSIN